MIFRNLIFEPEVVKQRLRAGMVSHHKQQASKCNGEQQHRVLWPAYNLNIAPPQGTGGRVPRRVTLMAYTSTRVSGCLKRPCPPPRIWRKNGSTSACPPPTRPTLPPRLAFRTRVSQTPASVANTDSRTCGRSLYGVRSGNVPTPRRPRVP